MGRMRKKEGVARFKPSDEEIYQEILNAPGALYDQGDIGDLVESFQEGLEASARISRSKTRQEKETEKNA